MPELSREAREFVELLTASGWSQSEAARRLFITAPHVNQIVNGSAQPSRPLIQLFKLTIMGEKPELITAVHKLSNEAKREITLKEEFRHPSWEDDVLRELRPLGPEDRAKVIDALRAVIRIVPKRGRPKSEEKAA